MIRTTTITSENEMSFLIVAFLVNVWGLRAMFTNDIEEGYYVLYNEFGEVFITIFIKIVALISTFSSKCLYGIFSKEFSSNTIV